MSLSKRFNACQIALVSSLTVLTTLPSEASAVLEEVIVTAQKRAENLQDVPVSVSVVQGALIAQNSIRDLEEMAAFVPNLSINQGPSVTSIYIRGLGSGDNQGFDQSVGLFVDDVYAGRSRQFTAPFLDVENVEVLRGPQGTLFGKNTIAGAMTITSARPTDALTGSLLISYETEFESSTVEGMVSGPLTDEISARVALKHADYKGFVYDTLRDRYEPENEQSVGRIMLQWQPAERELDALLKYERGSTDLTGRSSRLVNVGDWEPLFRERDPNYSLGNYSRSVSAPEFNNTDNQSLTLTISGAVGEYELTSITGYSEYEFEDGTDIDFSPIEVGLLRIPQEFEQLSQELRRTSPPGDHIDCIAGLYYLNNDLQSQWRLSSSFRGAAGGPIDDIPFELVPDMGFRKLFDQQSETYAAFASLNWYLTDTLTFNVGLRYTRETKDASRELEFTDYSTLIDFEEALSPAQQSIATVALQSRDIFEHTIDRTRDIDKYSPALKLRYQWNDDVMIYASASQAFKSGGFNEAGNKGDDLLEYTYDRTNPLLAAIGVDPEGDLQPAPFEFDEEEAIAFEVGVKSTLLNGRGTLNAALFHTRYDDLQISNFVGSGLVVTNAAEAISQGLEVDSRFAISPNLMMDVSFAYLDASYENYPDATCTIAQTTDFVESQNDFPQNCRQDLSDESLPYAPDWSGNIGVSYERAATELWLLRARLDLSYRGEQYLAPDLDETLREDSHLTGNLRVALLNERHGVEFSILVKNFTDETIRNAGNDPFLLEGPQFVYMNPPRTVTLQARWRYE